MKKLATHFGLVLVSLAMAGSQSLAVEFNLDFETDPIAQGIQFFGTSEWRTTEGNPGGYLKVTDANNSERGAIVFPDLTGGSIVTDFAISADLRVGGGTTSPADGFSFNLARPDDPVLDPVAAGSVGEGWAASPTGEANLPEEGTTTGLAIGFDEWFSGGSDTIGMSVRVDNEILAEIPLPTLNGALDDVTTLQTGPLGPGGQGDDTLLGWARLEIELDVSGNLRISWKGNQVFNEPVSYPASVGRLVFGGRTGGSNANHHIDNITLRINEAILTPGDTNGDGVADRMDFLNIRDNFNEEQTELLTGDLNLDRRTDILDFRLWKEAAAGAAAIPEPGSVALLIIGTLLVGVRARRLRASQ